MWRIVSVKTNTVENCPRIQAATHLVCQSITTDSELFSEFRNRYFQCSDIDVTDPGIRTLLT